MDKAVLDLVASVGGTTIATIGLVALFIGLRGFRINQEYERAVVYFLGRYAGTRGPGLFWIIPFFQWSTRVDVRVLSVNLSTQETLSRDGVAVKVNAVIWYKISDPNLAVNAVINPHETVVQAAETALRDTIGQNDLDQLLKSRDQVNQILMARLFPAATKWGLKIDAVEMRDLDIPPQMQRALAKEAEATREAKARLIKAQGEQAASETLSLAARTIGAVPGALEIRRLQTLAEIGTEHNSTIIFGLPQEFLAAAKKIGGGD